MDFIEETRWPTSGEDAAIANRIYEEWIEETNPQWHATRDRDRGKFMTALQKAYSSIHDERTADCAWVMFMMVLELRARSDGFVRQELDH